MNWDAIAAIAELLGAIGVIVSLVYLATQIRQNTRAAQLTSHEIILSSASSFNSLLSQNKDLARIYRVGAEDLASLDGDERTQFDFLHLQWFDWFENLYLRHERGFIDPGFWDRHISVMPPGLARPGVANWWAENKGTYSAGFAELVDGLILRGGKSAA
jgi:hypothetical protein